MKRTMSKLFQQGSGISFLGYKRNTLMAKRIEMVALVSEAVLRHDKKALLELVQECDRNGWKATAKRARREAQDLK